MGTRFIAFMLTLVCIGAFSGSSVHGADKGTGDQEQTTVPTVDQGSFFCKFACSPNACAASRSVFEKCKLCPQSMVSGCLMAASGVPAAAALNAAQSGQMLPPPGCVVPGDDQKDGDASGKKDGDGDKTSDADKDADGDKTSDGDKDADGDKTSDADKDGDGDKTPDADKDAGGDKATDADKSGDEDKGVDADVAAEAEAAVEADAGDGN